MKKSLLLLLFCLAIIKISAQNVPIESIVESPKTYDGESVEIEGIVTQYIESTSNSTAYYLIRGDYGGQLRVNTVDPDPEILKNYSVTGIIYYDSDSRSAFLSEKSRVIKSTISMDNTQDNNLIDAESTNELNDDSNNNLLLFLLFGGLAVLIVLVIIMITNKKKKENIVDNDLNQTTPKKGDLNIEKPISNVDYGDDFKTIKIDRRTIDNARTLKFIPGELKIISGADKGKSFKIAGYPTPKGNVITIGRKKIVGERSYAHIQLMQKTVSRDQAEIIQNDGRLIVKNLSKTNFTIVDGVELLPEDQLEFNTNSTIKVGEVEFQYIV